MNAAEVLRNPLLWKPITRQDALLQCVFRTVVVISQAHGLADASLFNHSNRYFQPGTRNLSGLRYFLKVQAPAGFGSRPGAGGGSSRSGSQAQASGRANARPDASAPSEDTQAPEIAPEPEKLPPRLRLTKLDCECFAPLADTVLIHYEITGDLDQAEAVHLRIASEKKPDRYLLDKKLDGKPLAEGMFMWDGSVTDAEYPGCVNLIGSPYWVQLGLAANGGSPKFTNKVEIRVELMQTELLVGDESGLGEDAENKEAVAALREELKRTPGKGRIHLPGSFFKKNSGEMYNFAAFTSYYEKLKIGVPIPLFVKLWLKGKNGSRIRSPKAVEGTRIVWDSLPEDEASLDANLSERDVHPAAKTFIKKVVLYKKDKTEPTGATSNWELGGIRTGLNARKYRLQFKPMIDGWKNGEPKLRGWSGFSRCSNAVGTSADSGMLYHNGRISGDRYFVAAYVDLDSNLDVKSEKIRESVNAARKSSSVGLQNWRDVKLAKAYKIGSGTPPLGFAEANAEFKKAALSIVVDPGIVVLEIKEKWKLSYQSVIQILSGDAFYKNACLPDPGEYPTAFASYNQYWENENQDAGFFGKIWHRIKAFFSGADEEQYIKRCTDSSIQIYTETVKAFPLGESGLTYFKFANNGEHNLVKGSYTAGIAPSIPGYTSRTKAVLFIFSSGPAIKTLIHEMGHNLFLPHAPGHWEPGKQPAGAEPRLHDKNQVCLMSYSPEKEYLCGFCYLRMGGWDDNLISNDGMVTDSYK